MEEEGGRDEDGEEKRPGAGGEAGEEGQASEEEGEEAGDQQQPKDGRGQRWADEQEKHGVSRGAWSVGGRWEVVPGVAGWWRRLVQRGGVAGRECC